MKRKTLCLALLVTFVFSAMAQLPENNSSWRLVASKSDEFDQGIDLGRWVLIGDSDPMWHFWGISKFLESNSSVKNGYLYLQTHKKDATYFTGGIHSKNPEYHFGYYELRAKVPKGRGFWHAFWLYGEGQEWYDEIDIFEPMGELNIAGRGTSFGVVDMRADNQHPYRIEFSDIGVDLSLDFHTFALKWQPDTLVFYIDGRVMGVCAKSDIIPQHPMYLYIDQQVSCPDKSSAWSCPDSAMDASLPQYFIVDYFRYYEKYECDKIVDGSNYDLMKDNRSVKKSYKLKSTSVPKRGPVVLKAETLELGEGFEVPIGAEFEFQSTECK